MSGGRLVVLDRSGRDVKRYTLARGLCTLGSAAACDIRVMLAAVSPHHATIAVHNSQTVVRNVGSGETAVNGRSVSVAALRHGDVITLGDRSLRWEYAAPTKRQQASLGLPLVPGTGRGAGPGAGAGGARRGSAGAPPPSRDRALQLAIEMNHRASMPASSGGKQVAIVQPQRRDANEQTSPARRAGPAAHGAHAAHADTRNTRLSPKTVPAETTMASLWMSSRKASPRPRPRPRRRAASARKRTPLRLAVLRRAQSVTKLRVVKIEDPLKIDHTKQAAIMLMAGHTPKARLAATLSKTPTYVVKKPSPVRKTPARKSRQGGRSSNETGDGVTPKRASTYSDSRRSTKRSSGNRSVTLLEITDSDTRSMRAGRAATRPTKSPQKSPLLPSPKKSALKDLSKKGNRKTESIKFDLSNLEAHQDSEITSRLDSEESMSEDELTLHYSESSAHSPSPRKSVNSRSSRMLDKLGSTLTFSPSRTLTPNSQSTRRSARGSMLLQKALESSRMSDYTDQSRNATVASAFKTRTLSPRTRNMESYSIVDLVSIDSDTSKSIYNSADSTNTTDYGTPNASGRKTRSTINPTLLGSSTPYVAHARATRSKSNPNVSKMSTRSSAATRRSKSLSTPENQQISVNSTRLSRASRSRSRINDSDLLLLDDTELEDSSPKTSRRARTKPNTIDNSKVNWSNTSMDSPEKEGTSTPENRHSPVEVGTPVLSIQSLLNSSQSSLRSLSSAKKGKKSVNYKRKTIGVVSEPKRRPANKSKSVGVSARQTVLRLSKDSSEISDRTDEGAPRPDNEDTVTPKSSVTLVQEAVKNKHSTAKKPQSKRSIIDDLNQSDIIKQLFNSPVKRKLSQSMTEFSRKQHSDDDEIVIAKRATRHTTALTGGGRTIDDSMSELSGRFTPERFVSPLSTPSHSPNLSGIKRLFQESTPENELSDVRGVGSSLRTHRTRRSAKNDLTNVSGLKLMFGKSPVIRLSDVALQVFKPSPENDLRRVSGVKSLFQRASPRNDLSDVRGVKKLFRKFPKNDLRNVSGVKRTLRNSPKNDLTDVRGVRKMFKLGGDKQSLLDVSGIEELFNTSDRSTQNTHAENLFDQWVGKPTVRSVYSSTFSTKPIPKPKSKKGTLHASLDVIPDNVEEWLEHELQKRFHRDEPSTSKSRDASRNATKELQNLVTCTVAGNVPVRASRTRNSSVAKKSASEMYSAHTLPIKKRSLVECSVEIGKPKLPIKKRAVVHSTPVKGRLDLTMNASELGRVSPIAAVDHTNVDHRTSLNRTTRQQKTIPEPPKGRLSKAKTPQKTPVKSSPGPPQASPEVVASSPGPPQASPEVVASSPPERVTSNRKSTTQHNVTRRRSSLVISKKAPVMSPKPDHPSRETSRARPVKRATRSKNEQTIETPKRTRVRAQKATVVVPKPSPKLKPQAKGKEKKTETEEKPKRTLKNSPAEIEPQPRRTRGNKNDLKDKENKTDNVPTEKPKRGRKAAAIETEPPAATRARGSAQVKTRGKSATKVEKADEKQPKTRSKKVEAQVSVNSEPTARRGRKVMENVSLETQPQTRRRKAEAPVESERTARGNKVQTQSSVQSEPVTRARRAKASDNTVIPETRGRKKKTVAVEEVPPKVTKSETKRGRKAAEPANTAKANDNAKAKAAQDAGASQQQSRTRGRPRKAVEPASAPTTATTATRGRKAAEPKEPPATDKRKRKTKVEASPAKGKKPAPAEAKKARGADAAPAEARAATGRSRRRQRAPRCDTAVLNSNIRCISNTDIL